MSAIVMIFGGMFPGANVLYFCSPHPGAAAVAAEHEAGMTATFARFTLWSGASESQTPLRRQSVISPMESTNEDFVGDPGLVRSRPVGSGRARVVEFS